MATAPSPPYMLHTCTIEVVGDMYYTKLYAYYIMVYDRYIIRNHLQVAMINVCMLSVASMPTKLLYKGIQNASTVATMMLLFCMQKHKTVN